MNQPENENSNINNMNTSNKNIKSILFMSIGSVVASFGIVMINVLSVFSLLLIPALFAFPIIIKEPKLLLIPSVFFLLVIIIFYGFIFPYIIPLLILVVAITAAFGIIAGFFIKTIKGSAKKRPAIIKAIGIMSLLIPFLFIANFVFIGNPIGSFHARSKIESYVKKHYTDFDFVVSFPKYHLHHDGYYYTATVHARNDKSINFEIVYFSRTGSVDYTYNTGHFRDEYSNVLNSLIMPLMEKEFGNSINRVRTSQSGSSRNPEYYFEIELRIRDLAPHTLSEAIIKCRDIIEQNEISIKYYSFDFKTDDKEMKISHLQTKRMNDELVKIIEKMQETFDSSGYMDIGDFPQTYYKFGYSK